MRRPSPWLSSNARLALLAYGTMAALGCGWAALRGDLTPWSRPASLALPTGVPGWAASVGAGVALALATVALSRVLLSRVRWARELEAHFRAVLGAPPPKEIALLALTSGISEELFFRGALQPVLGLGLASVVFGAVHIPPSRALWPWSAWAVAMGLCLGTIFEITGELVGAIVAHVLVNYLNLRHMLAPGRRAATTLPQSGSAETLSS